MPKWADNHNINQNEKNYVQDTYIHISNFEFIRLLNTRHNKITQLLFLKKF